MRIRFHGAQAFVFFFFNDTATTEIYTLSLHDALPISPVTIRSRMPSSACDWRDRKSTRLNSSHDQISYAVFCLKKKKNRKAAKPHGGSDAKKPVLKTCRYVGRPSTQSACTP